MKPLLLILALVGLAGCASKQPETRNENAVSNAYEQDQVVARADSMDSRPPWLKETEPFEVSNGVVVSLGQTEIPGDHRVDAAYRIAESNARSRIVEVIQQRMVSQFQNVEGGTGFDQRQTEYITTQFSNMKLSNIRPGKRYWEKVLTQRANGEKELVLKVFATVTMTEADLKREIYRVLDASKGRSGITPELAEKAKKQWDLASQVD